MLSQGFVSSCSAVKGRMLEWYATSAGLVLSIPASTYGDYQVIQVPPGHARSRRALVTLWLSARRCLMTQAKI